MTLTEFLLARIVEDERPTWTLEPYPCAPGCCAPEGWVGSQCRYCDATPVYGGTPKAIIESALDHAESIHQRSRVLAECAAKRRIVDLALEAHAMNDEGPDMADAYMRDTLRLIGLPYAGHADYREEWKP